MRLLLFVILFVSVAVNAQAVSVKGAGDVDLTDFVCTPVSDSKLLHQICYDETKRYLIAQIGDEYYDSCKVRPDQLAELMGAKNIAARYNQIKSRHKCSAARRLKVHAGQPAMDP